ncbi:AMP-binding protein [Pigmentiphaga daeguensis]|uniref:AMP-binding protein n=1 Tax=Pigmentiphaga daeguensis TaxID=414049 RepID=A0ABN1BSK8_9BURK
MNVPSRLGDLILAALRRWPDRLALVDETHRLSYGELEQRIATALGIFGRLGLRPGDTVAQLSGNRNEMFCIMAAAYIGGFRSVTLHPVAGANDHAAILDDCRPALVVGESPYAERLAWLKERCVRVGHWRSHDTGDGLPPFWQEAHAAEPAAQVRGEPEDIIRLAYTGGTTGKPKGVMLSNRAMAANARLWLEGLEWPDGVRCLCSAPISHGAGSLIYPTLARGGTVYLQRGFSAERWLATVQAEGINTTFIVPTMIYALLDHPATRGADLSSLRALVYGAAPISPPRIREALSVFGPVLVQTYGQTEAPNTILILDQAAHAAADEARLASAGRPFPGLDVRLLDDLNQPAAAGQIGEICVRGPLLMSGYHNAADETAATLRDGWLHTGDLARQDDDGYFYLVDRRKDLIISGGFNIYPREIEDVLATHPEVHASAVIGIPDAKWGEAVKAIVVRRGERIQPQELIDYIRARKGSVHAPKSVDFVDALPLTGLGKPDKRALRQRYWHQQDREIA